MKTTIDVNKLTIAEYPVNIDDKFSISTSTNDLVFITEIIGDTTVTLTFEHPINEDLFVRVEKADGTKKNFSIFYNAPEPVTQPNLINLKEKIEILDGFVLLDTSINPSILINEYSVEELFNYPDFPTKKTILNFKDSLTKLDFKFTNNTLYEIVYTFEKSRTKFLYMFEKPSIFYSSTEELKRFFTSQSLNNGFYKDEELLLLVWRKSLEAHAISGLTYDLKPSSHAISLFEKYVKYSVACDYLFSLLSNTNINDENMFKSVGKVSLSDLSVSGDSSTPYDSYSTTYMRFLREKDTLVKEIRQHCSFKFNDSDYKKPLSNNKRIGWF